MPDIIGGEFAINPALVNPDSKFYLDADEILYASGRSALYFILLNIKKNNPLIDTVLLPEYLCGSIFDAVTNAGFKYIFYKIEITLTPDINDIMDIAVSTSCLLLINYFGLINIEPIIGKIKEFRPDICIVLDNVQALFEMRKNTRANYAFTSLRKWIPVPDGAIVKTKEHGMLVPRQKNSFSQWKFVAGLLKTYRFFPEVDDAVYLDLFSKGEQALETSFDCVCSSISLSILNKLDYVDIASRRRENALFLSNELKQMDDSWLIFDDVLTLSDKVPMFLPLRTKKRDAIKRKLAGNNIFCPVHWLRPPSIPCGECSFHIYETEISLIIDQRYSEHDMKRIFDIIKSCKV
jgi:hypothetical protein